MSVPHQGLAARFAAWRILHDVRHGVPFDVALSRAVHDLEPDDRRLVHELAAGVFRARTELDQVLEPAVNRGLASVRADTLDVLRLGAFQLLHLDRVPDHAAVQTTVSVARRLGGDKVAGFVNAILRRVAKRGPTTAARGLASQFSHPEWLVERWIARFGPTETAALLEANNQRPSLVLQPARQSAGDLRAALDAAGVAHRPAPFDAGIVVDASRPTTLPGFQEGAFIVQDPAQRLVARFLDPDPASVVLDACAAPGGKAIAIAPNVRLVVAADRRRGRTHRLQASVARAGASNIQVIEADALHPPARQVDAVLLDVPCLGTGTFARHPDARWRVTPEALAELVAQGAQFLRSAAAVVAPGGLLLFATCSLEPEENQHQIARFLADDTRFRRDPPTAMPAQTLTADGDLMLLPQRHGTDGAFAARLRKAVG